VTAPISVLVMAHGTPGSVAEIETFYTRIRRGRPPTRDQLAELTARYEAIGGLSPLSERTRAQVDGLAAQLEEAAPGRYRVAYGTKHADPPLEEAAIELARGGGDGLVGIVLTPHRSARGSEEYLDRAERAVAEAAPTLRFERVEQWFDAPGMPELWANRVTNALAGRGAGSVVVFSAHSVPESATAGDDPYRVQVERTAELVAAAAGLDRAGVPWRVAWQSAGRTDQRWIGPDLLSTLDEVGRAGNRAVVVCPIGFVSDHLEVLYDLDIEARDRAEAVGLSFDRTESLNADPDFLAVLAGVVDRAAACLNA